MTYDKIPEELIQLDRWVCWRWEDKLKRDGTPDKPAKVPINPFSGNRAMSSNPSTWGTFESAVERAGKDNLPGIGFMFNRDGIIGVDIDGCRDPETGALSPEAKEIINTLESYTEFSQSGKGVHIICRGRLPEGKRRKGNVEMYESERYFIMTGNVMDDSHADIEERTEALADIHAKFLADKPKQPAKRQEAAPVDLDDDQLMEKAMNAKNGHLFKALYYGNWKGLYKSQSEADIAFCNLLAYWYGRDTSRMMTIFRKSALYRDKWDERHGAHTYGEMTINRAATDCRDVYSKPSSRKAKVASGGQPDSEMGYDQLGGSPVLRKDKIKTFALNDFGLGERFVHHCGKYARFCKSWGMWLLWDGKRWKPDETGEVEEWGRQVIKKIPEEAAAVSDDDVRSRILKFAAKCCHRNYLENMLRMAQTMPGIPVTPAQLDKDTWVINCDNGTLDLKTGTLKPHNPQDMITKVTPLEYRKSVFCPTFMKFLNRIFNGNKDLISFVQRAAGYSLTGSTVEQVLFLCHGSGANGKSTLINAICECLGDYGTSTPMTTFVDRQAGAATNDIARMRGLRIITALETNKGGYLDEGTVKQLTGGDPISARFLHKEFFEFMPTFKFWLGFNHKPVIKGTDYGIWRRIKLIPFEETISEDEKDKQLPEKLKSEMPGILSWMVEGCLEWQREGLKSPLEIESATSEYRDEMDVFGDFLKTWCVIDPNVKSRNDEFYKYYELYCKESNIRAMSGKRIVAAMKERGFKIDADRSRRFFWLGIGLGQDESEELQYWQK